MKLQYPVCVGRRVLLLALLFVLIGAGTPAVRATQDTLPPTKLRFVVYGDTRDGHNTHRRLVDLIMAQRPQFVLQTGDLVAYGGDKALWRIYDDITKPLRETGVTIYPSRGNHDLGGPGYEQRVPVTVASSGSKFYYSFDLGDCHFASVDCFEPNAPGTPQYRWLESDLAAAQKTARHTFVFFHVAPYSIGDGHGSDVKLRKRICPLFAKYGVRAVFNGHEHIYYRTTRDGVPYIIAGGGGAPLYGADPRNGAIKGDKWESVHHIVVCDVDGDKVTFRAIRENGSTLDTHTVTAPARK